MSYWHELERECQELKIKLNAINNLAVKFREDGPFTHQEAFDRVAEIYNLSLQKGGD